MNISNWYGIFPHHQKIILVTIEVLMTVYLKWKANVLLLHMLTMTKPMSRQLENTY